MKKLKIYFSKLPINNYRFAIREVKSNGEKKYWPMIKSPGILSSWRFIVRLEDELVVMDHEHPNGFTEEECAQRINSYKTQLILKWNQSQVSVKYYIYDDSIRPGD